MKIFFGGAQWGPMPHLRILRLCPNMHLDSIPHNLVKFQAIWCSSFGDTALGSWAKFSKTADFNVKCQNWLFSKHLNTYLALRAARLPGFK